VVIETKVTRFIRNCWYVAAWAVEIPDDGLFHRTLLNEAVLIYRTSSGRLTAPYTLIVEWRAPSFLHLYTGAAPAGTGAPEGNLAPETMQYKHCSVQTPETEDTLEPIAIVHDAAMIKARAMIDQMLEAEAAC
jgi:hypothetical protein